MKRVLLVAFGCLLLIPPATPFGLAYFVFLYFYLRKERKHDGKLEMKETSLDDESTVKKIWPDINKTCNRKQYKKIQELYK